MRLSSCATHAGGVGMDVDLDGWRRDGGGFPEDIIPCPLGHNQLQNTYYNLSRVDEGALKEGSAYSMEEQALISFYTNPPLTRDHKGGKGGETSMRPLAPSTLETRIRVLREFVGFVLKWLLLQPTMMHVMSATLVAKYMGFLQAKGIAAVTMRRAANTLGQVVTFVCSPQFPTQRVWPATYLAELSKWYGNLQGKLYILWRAAQTHTHPNLLSLWSCWQFATAEWAAFMQAYVANHCTFTAALARRCMECGLRLMLVGCHQPPLREGMLRVLHSHASSAHCVYGHCVDKSKCPTNHVNYFADRNGKHGEMFVLHFKNANIKGEQLLPLSGELLTVCVLLERAANFVGSPTLFFDTSNTTFDLSNFSTTATRLLSFDNHHLNANTMRHMYVTHWNDYINHPTTQLIGLGVDQLTLEAAALMLNSPAAWEQAYDDSICDRHTLTILAHWPKFTAFVEQAHLDLASRQDLDPLTLSLASLSL